MAKSVLLVFTSPASAEQDAEFNDWYQNVHIPEVTDQVEQITAGTRYRVIDPENPEAVRYLCVWDVEADDVMEAAAGLGAAMPTLTMTESMDVSNNPPAMHWGQGV